MDWSQVALGLPRAVFHMSTRNSGLGVRSHGSSPSMSTPQICVNSILHSSHTQLLKQANLVPGPELGVTLYGNISDF